MGKRKSSYREEDFEFEEVDDDVEVDDEFEEVDDEADVDDTLDSLDDLEEDDQPEEPVEQKPKRRKKAAKKKVEPADESSSAAEEAAEPEAEPEPEAEKEIDYPPDDEMAVAALKKLRIRLDTTEKGNVWRVIFDDTTGTDQQLLLLGGLPALKEVWLLGTKAKPADAEKLKETRPQLKVYH